MKFGPLFKELMKSQAKYKVLQGGTSSGKTIAALQYLAVKASTNENIVITIVGQDLPNLRKGSMRDFDRFIGSDPHIVNHILKQNKSEHCHYFHSKSIIEFAAFQDEQDAKNGKRNILFLNEANGIGWNIAWQLMLRSYDEVIIDYNPNNEFWCHEHLLSGKDKQFAGKVDLFISDHRHNPFLSKEEHEGIENISDKDMWKVYARGKTGRITGLVYGHFIKVDGPPEIYDRIFWGIDYGYTNDPTAIVKIHALGKRRWWKEICYTPGLSASVIKQLFYENGYKPGQMIYSEADKNMINELRILGLPVYPAIKGPGSIAAGISKVKEREIFYYDSPNLEQEHANYKWVSAVDLRTGKQVMTNQPVDTDNHILDAGRYGEYTDSFRNRTEK